MIEFNEFEKKINYNKKCTWQCIRVTGQVRIGRIRRIQLPVCRWSSWTHRGVSRTVQLHNPSRNWNLLQLLHPHNHRGICHLHISVKTIHENGRSHTNKKFGAATWVKKVGRILIRKRKPIPSYYVPCTAASKKKNTDCATSVICCKLHFHRKQLCMIN